MAIQQSNYLIHYQLKIRLPGFAKQTAVNSLLQLAYLPLSSSRVLTLSL